MYSREHFEKLAQSVLGWTFFSRSQFGYYVDQHLESMWMGYCLAAGLTWKEGYETPEGTDR